MAERLKAICHIARRLTGAEARRFNETVDATPEGVDDATWASAQPEAERIFVEMVDGIDWGRLLIEAHHRHVALGHGGTFHGSPDIGFSTFQEVCGHCLNETLLSLDTRPDWTAQPESPRCLIYQPPGLDIPLVAPPGFDMAGGAPTGPAVDDNLGKDRP